MEIIMIMQYHLFCRPALCLPERLQTYTRFWR